MPLIRHPQQGAIGDAAARFDEVNGGQIGGGNKNAWAEGKKVDWLIGFTDHHVGNGEGGLADVERVAHLQTEPIQQVLADDDVAGGEDLGKRPFACQPHLAIKRIPWLHHL